MQENSDDPVFCFTSDLDWAPDSPRYDAKINEVARQVALIDQDHNQIGHVIGYVLKARG